MPEIAVVIPVRNAEASIGRTLDLVLAQAADLASQTGTNLEVVVVDDASTDATHDAAERAAKALAPGLGSAAAVTVLRRAERGGPNAARNDGVRASSAPTIVFLDGDDEPLPGWLRALVDAVGAVGGPDVIVGGTYVVPGPRGRASTILASSRTAFGYPYAVGGALATTRTMLDRAGGFDETLVRGGTEVALCIRAQRDLGARVVPVDDARVTHRVSGAWIGRARLHYARERGHQQVRRMFAGPDGVALPARSGSATWSERMAGAGSWSLLSAEIAGRAAGRVRFGLLSDGHD